MSVLIQGSQLRALLQGVRVERATDTLPQSTDEALFTITGGRVWITSIVGEVTTVIGTGTTPDAKLKFNPTATGSDIDLCATASLADDAVGTLYSITGDFSDALKTAHILALETDSVLERPILLSEGDIELDLDESVTGSVAWTLTYIPYDDGAAIAAA